MGGGILVYGTDGSADTIDRLGFEWGGPPPIRYNGPDFNRERSFLYRAKHHEPWLRSLKRETGSAFLLEWWLAPAPTGQAYTSTIVHHRPADTVLRATVRYFIEQASTTGDAPPMVDIRRDARPARLANAAIVESRVPGFARRVDEDHWGDAWAEMHDVFNAMDEFWKLL